MAPHAEYDVNHLVQESEVGSEDAELVTISIGKIMNCDKVAEESLLRASKDLGFFYLDIFEHALQNAARDKPVNLPKSFQERRELIEATSQTLGNIGRVLLDSLSRSLKLEGKDNLAEHHRRGHASPTALGLLKYLPYMSQSEEVGHVSHTDIGSLSMVFSEVGGLQVYHPEKKAWMFIKPKPGHTVCNIGDSTEFLSKNMLRSSLHRVIPHPAEKDKSKLTVVYLMRPETDAVFVDRAGKSWRSVDWHNMKNRLFAEDLESQASNLALTGRLGQDDLWDEKEI
ncbi:1-aminocyclopropane-1-carboxylate oxidase [Colletotrichum cereale]|nr:1-aminocyclopropane-1-carboxylate oxidase [Colletotrichum cereale]